MACELKNKTMNPLCSNSIPDLEDNVVIFDQYVNSEEFVVPDRLGIPRKTWAGLEEDVRVTLSDLDPKVEQLISEKIIAQGGVEIVNDFGNSLTKVINQDFLTRHLKTTSTMWIESMGVSKDTSPEFNASIFKGMIEDKGIVLSADSYEYNFTGERLIVNSSLSDIVVNLSGLNIFRNFGGIQADQAKTLHANFNIDADNTWCKGFIRARQLDYFNIDSLTFRNVKVVDDGDNTKHFFGFEYSSNLLADKSINGVINNLEAHNIITTTVSNTSDETSLPCTVIGNFGSQVGRVNYHNICINNVNISEFYSIDVNGVMIQGDSDAFRLFCNPINLNIGNLISRNVAKRTIKTKCDGIIRIENCVINYDDRFSNINHTSFVDCQEVGSGQTTVIVESGVFDSINGNRFTSAVSADHIFHISKMKINKGTIYSNNEILTNALVEDSTLNDCSIRARDGVVNLNRVIANNLTDGTSKIFTINESTITLTGTSTAPVFSNVSIYNSTINTDLQKIIGDVETLNNIKIIVNQVGAMNPFRVSGNFAYLRDISVSGMQNMSLVENRVDKEITMSVSGVIGDISNNIMFSPTGNVSITISDSTIIKTSGAGIINKKTAVYE